MTSRQARLSVGAAIEAGYRLIDTAKIYQNETEVGSAVISSTVPREQLIVTTKLWGSDQPDAERGLDESLERLGLDYVDLYLVHWPVSGLVAQTWKQMERAYSSGKTKAIGVSNHSDAELARILDICEVVPAVNQIPISPFGFDQALIDFCHDHDIVVEAYSPLNKGIGIDDSALTQIAEAHSKTSAQIMLRWAIQKGTVPIPKAASTDHIQENAEVFDLELSDDEMRRLDSLSLV
jgi:methylglyoxal/glyoxal reductase